MNIFQKKVAEATAKKEASIKQKIAFTKKMSKLVGMTPEIAHKSGLVFATKSYEFYGVSFWKNSKISRYFWAVRVTGDVVKCTPEGCTVPKPVDHDKFFAELAIELKKKVNEA